MIHQLALGDTEKRTERRYTRLARDFLPYILLTYKAKMEQNLNLF